MPTVGPHNEEQFLLLPPLSFSLIQKVYSLERFLAEVHFTAFIKHFIKKIISFRKMIFLSIVVSLCFIIGFR